MKVFSICSLAMISSLGLGCASATRNTYKNQDRGEEYRLDLVADSYVLPVFEHRRRSYVQGRSGQRYVLRITNNSARRVEVVASVDGRDVVDGQPMDTKKRGYIVMPHATSVIDGWRTSMNTVAAFRFTSPKDSYATRMGSSSRELGKIQVAVFREKEVPHGPLVLPDRPDNYDDAAPAFDLMEEQKQSTAAPAESSNGESWGSRRRRQKKSNLGTQFGETHHSDVQETDFIRESSSPDFWLGLVYDDAQGLCDRGLKDFCRQASQPLQPLQRQPEQQFAQPPP